MKRGPSRSTLKLIHSILKYSKNDFEIKNLLDIGAGIGAIGLTLNEKTSLNVTCLDVSTAYLKISKQEANQRGIIERFKFINEDILIAADDLPPADFVTLDKAICCYEDYKTLVRTSIKKSKDLYGIVIPRDTWWVRTINKTGNLLRWLFRTTFRTFVHPVNQINEIILSSGFKNIYFANAREWQILLYKKIESN